MSDIITKVFYFSLCQFLTLVSIVYTSEFHKIDTCCYISDRIRTLGSKISENILTSGP